MIQQEMVKELSESKLYWPHKRLFGKVYQLCHLYFNIFLEIQAVVLLMSQLLSSQRLLYR